VSLGDEGDDRVEDPEGTVLGSQGPRIPNDAPGALDHANADMRPSYIDPNGVVGLHSAASSGDTAGDLRQRAWCLDDSSRGIVVTGMKRAGGESTRTEQR
jgi:hypothetical protein